MSETTGRAQQVDSGVAGAVSAGVPGTGTGRSPDDGLLLHDLEVLNTLHRIADSSGLSLAERLSAIVKVVAFHLRSDACSIYLEDRAHGGRFVLTATHGLNPEAVGRISLAPGEGVTGWVGREQVALPISDISHDPRFKMISGMGEEELHAILAAPIRLEQRLIGVINVQGRQVSEYVPQQVRLLETIGMHLGGIIRTTQLYEDTRKQLKHLRIINGVGQALASTLNLESLLRMVMEKSRELTQTRGGLLRLWDDERQQLVVKVTTGEPLPEPELRPLYLGEGLPGMAALKQEGYLVEGREGSRYAHLLPQGVVSNYLCVPVVDQGRCIGTISVFDREPGEHGVGRLTEDDQSLLKSLSNQVAVAIRNARACDALSSTVEDLRQTRDLLVRNEALAAVGRMSDAVVQELRVPLVPMEGLLRRLQRDDLDADQRTTYLSMVLRETERMGAFLNQVLEFARADTIRPERREVDTFVAAVIEARRERLGECGIAVVPRLNSDCLVPMDPERVECALNHILDNAERAMPLGGEVFLRTERCYFPLPGRRAEGVCISIRDSGTGISEEALAHVFEPFYSTREGGGRGLSLAIAYRIARAHGGTLLASNPPEGGAEFSLFLPAPPVP
ncbi:MAG: GAF domain-containing protein [Nitrospirota bacterium]|nr:GAF domain-containing protein [Nitrospirota bacterium]